MKKLILSLLYPFWFFLARTIAGNSIMMMVVLFIPMGLISLLPGFQNLTGSAAESVGMGVAIFSLLVSPITASIFFDASEYLEAHYKNYSYKV